MDKMSLFDSESSIAMDKGLGIEASMFLLMHKDIRVALLRFNRATGEVMDLLEVYDNYELPLGVPATFNGLKCWWNSRAIPISRRRLNNVLNVTEEISNLALTLVNKGLTLIDHYWVKHVADCVIWDDVNFFDNNFKDDVGELLFNNITNTSNGPLEMSPSSSVDGVMTKRWITRKDARMLVKVDERYNNQQFANEIIASKLHELLGFDNYVKYFGINVKFNNKIIKACASRCFVNNYSEFISINQLIRFDNKRANESDYTRIIRVLEENGINRAESKEFLDYQFVTDFLITNTDRHTGNYGIIKDNKGTRMAPIFDNGNSLFYNLEDVPFGKEMFKIFSNGLWREEMNLFRSVSIPKLDIDKLNSFSNDIKDLLNSYTSLSEVRINDTVIGYKSKVNIVRSKM